MRQIKFRGKMENGQWVFGYYWNSLCGNRFIRVVIENDQFVIKDYEVDPTTIGQFTGLKDKNRKEIYEGDVVVFYEKYQGKIAYRIGGFNFERGNGNTVMQALNPLDCKVIGNIHDNPELLESVRE